jgi:acyl carrier protein
MTDDSALQPDPVRDQILAFIRDELLGPENDIGPDDDLLSGELLDSMAVLQLATYVDQAFTIGMQPSDFRVENFQTVNALTRFVRASSTA